MRALVLGATGFVGNALVKTLLRLDVHVLAVGRTELNCLPQFFHTIDYLSLDITKLNNYDALLQDIDIVFYLVSTTNPTNSELDRTIDIRNNILPSIMFFEACIKKGIKKLFFYSSGGTVYGETQLHVPIKETNFLQPICSYGIQKLTIESYLHLYRVHYGLESYILRLSNPYDLNIVSKNGVGVVSIFYDKLKNKQLINLMGKGNIVRDYIALNDLDTFIEKILSYNGVFKIFNVGTGIGTSLNEIVSSLASSLKVKPLVNYIDKRPQDVAYNVLDINRSRSELKWSPISKLSEVMASIRG